ncbi:MAG: peptide ABC transporter substrate-binding protein [Proteobacteria bacterium]|nr:peptide ABC transporter substrate-binding protein [Pseudomonadota bacterium]
MIRPTRRSVLVGAAALPFLRIGRAHARTAGVLTFGLSSYPPTIQPWANAGTAAGTIKLMIYRGLLGYDQKGALRGELAATWVRDGANAWGFKLRDAVFHNGEKVKSADVKWTLEQIATEKSTAYFRTPMQGIDRVEAPDDTTVRIVMKQPTATLPEWLASFHTPIIWRKSEGPQPIGAGPFVLKAQERGVSLDLEAFPKYYKPGLPKLKAVRAVVYADENLRVAALQTGDVDLIEYVPWQSMEAISKDAKLRLDAVDGPFMYLVFNGSKPPFNDPRVRKAVAHAIRRDDIVKAAFFGRGSALAHLPIAAESAFYNPELKDGWAYDPARAKQLLAEAGVAGGFTCSFLSTAQYGMHKDSAEVVQQNLAAIGIQAELNLPDWATRVSIGNKGQYDMAMMGTTTDSNDPDGVANLIDGSLSPAYVRSFGLKTPKISELLAAGRAEFDPAKRKAIYRSVEETAIAEVPLVGLAWRSQGYAMQKDVTGFKNLPGALTFFSGTTLEDTAIS